MEAIDTLKAMVTHLNCLKHKPGLGMKPRESWTELLKFELPENEDILCMSPTLTHAGVWTYPVIRQRKGKSKGENNCPLLIGAKLLQRIHQKLLKGVKIRVLWPTTLHRMKAFVMAVGGDVLEMIGHITVL